MICAECETPLTGRQERCCSIRCRNRRARRIASQQDGHRFGPKPETDPQRLEERKQRRRESKRRYKAEHRVTIRIQNDASRRRRRLAHPERTRAKQRAMYWKHREKRIAYMAEDRRRKPEAYRARSRNYYRQNAGARRAYAAARRALRPKLPPRPRRPARPRPPKWRLDCVRCGQLLTRKQRYYCSKRCRAFIEWSMQTGVSQRARSDKTTTPDKMRAYQRKWRKENPGKAVAYFKRWKTKLISDPARRDKLIQITLRQRLQGRINCALKPLKSRNTARVTDLIGCTITDLRAHLEVLFLPGMTWENRRLWHIDHIRPCKSFDLIDIAQRHACFHWSNLQPLWAHDNLTKSARLDHPLAKPHGRVPAIRRAAKKPIQLPLAFAAGTASATQSAPPQERRAPSRRGLETSRGPY